MSRIAMYMTLALSLVLITGCHNGMSSTSQPSGMSMSAPSQAIVVSGGQGPGTVVFIPTSDPMQPMMMSTAGAEVCPDCKAAAIKYFQTGMIEPKCSKCGATRTVITLVTPTNGHQ